MRLNRLFLSLALLTASYLPAAAQVITKFVLINADTDQDIAELTDGYVINLNEVGRNLNVRAEVNSTVGSIRFGLDGNPNFQIEGVAPYALAGDRNGDYLSWTPSLGDHILTATAFSELNGGGSELGSLRVDFEVVENTVTITPPSDPGTGAVTINGELKKWHKITLSFDGPAYAETSTGPNPFLDYRLNVTFTNGAKSYVVPGYFAADGNAAETSAVEGNVWRVHFAPDQEGEWNYSVSFRLGANVAISDDPDEGSGISPIDGASGSFIVGPTDKIAPDNRALGRLRYVNQRYLQYAETGDYFLKGGADAPENFLAYEDFDNTPNIGNRRKSWAPHADDWKTGDPSWQNGKGTEIVGAVNYLASKGVNVFSFLTMNIEGDDRNVFPYVSDSDFKVFDCSKLDQWEIVLEHADHLGMYLHFKTQETENDQLLDGGDVGQFRQLYYRELVARFGHHLALNWNLGEENTQSRTQRIAMAQWFKDHDPYGHHRVLHTYPNATDNVYNGLIGNQSEYTGVSIQTDWRNVHSETAKWVERSLNSGKIWVVANDEQGNANTGVPPDPGYPGYNGSNPDHHAIRQEVLWGNLMAGGAGVEYYFGYQLPESDLSLQDFRSRDQSWNFVRHALEFFNALPFEQMTPNDDLVSEGWCFALEGQSYVIYFKEGGSGTLELSDNQQYTVKWYNPRTGNYADGSKTSLTGPGEIELGDPPSDPSNDWAVLVSRNISGNVPPIADFSTDITTGVAPLLVQFDASTSSDSDGNIVRYEWNFGDGEMAEGETVSHTYQSAGMYTARLVVTDNGGAIDTKELLINIESANGGECSDLVTMFSKDFPYQNTQFYLDDFTGMPLLAINPNQYQTAEVAQAFTGASCVYDITFHGIGESDGQSEFRLFIGGNYLGDIQLPLSTQDWEAGAAFNTTYKNVPIEEGAEIRVFGKVGTDGQEFSRARWLKIDFRPVAIESNCDAIWESKDGLVVIEMENNNLVDQWEETTTTDGYSGEGYIQWTGDQFFNQTGNGELRYRVQINETGSYAFDWRVGVGLGNDATEHNDSWLKIEADNFYGIRPNGNSQVKPKPVCNNDPNYDCPDGSTANGFFKVYGGPINGWEWKAKTSDNDAHDIFVDFLETGVYDIVVNARSSFHRIDRMVMFKLGTVTQSTARQLSNEETFCEVDGNYTVTFLVADGNQALQSAEVSMNNGTSTTEADGKVSFANIPGGLTEYSVELPGYSPASGRINVTSDLTILVTLDLRTSTTPTLNQSTFELFPNPAAEIVNISMTNWKNAQLQLLAIDGRLIKEAILTDSITPLSLAGLSKGMYIVLVRQDGQLLRELLVID